jgi:hypothetical protein
MVFAHGLPQTRRNDAAAWRGEVFDAAPLLPASPRGRRNVRYVMLS